jgi:hypothetical protein
MNPVLAAWLARHAPVAAWLRRPEYDDDPRPAAELDLLVFDDRVDGMALAREPGTPALDIVRLPAALLADPARLAAWGLFTHRLASADLVHDRDGRGAAAQAAWTAAWRTPAAVDRRVSAFLDTGRLTVREIGVSWDWPALGFFWLQIAGSALIAARLDAAGHWCPNVYTRPLAAARRAEAPGGAPLEAPLRAVLRLDGVDPAPLPALLAQLHARVRERCLPEPHWPESISPAAREEWRYWIAPAELDERLAATAALAAGGEAAAAVLYLRYAAYSLLRVAMLHQRALDRWPQTVVFLQPETEIRPDLVRHQPELLPLADALLGGGDIAALQDAVAATQAARRDLLADLAARGVVPSEQRPWLPHRAPPPLPG